MMMNVYLFVLYLVVVKELCNILGYPQENVTANLMLRLITTQVHPWSEGIAL
jgi:hypothetical protein